ncbi:MAG: choice-of-anchor H family protein [Woeseiaceae bacterium]
MKQSIFTAILLGAFALTHSAIAADVRETSSTQGLTSERNVSDPSPAFKSETDAPAMKGALGDRSNRKTPAQRDASAAVNQDFWIFDAQTVLRDDFDRDGFFSRLELTFDADTVFEGANVYAVLYLSLEGGDWVEYGSTDIFEIYGTSGNDEYFFDSDLVTGFPTGYYDVLIDLYDDFDGRLVATFGPDDSAELFDLPIESQSNDSANETIVVISNEGGGGSTTPIMLALLGTLLLRRRLIKFAK